MDSAAPVALGALLAVGTSLVVEIIRTWIADRRTKRLLTSLLKIEIPTILTAIDRLIEDTGKLGYIPLLIIGEIAQTRQGFDRNRDWIILYRGDSFRRDVIEFYQRLGSICLETTALEGVANQAQFVEWVRGRRPEILGRFRDLAPRARELLGKIDSQ